MVDRTLDVEAKLESLRAVARWLADAAQTGGFPYEVAFGLDVAVHEAVENMVLHGCKDGAPHRIQLTIRADDWRVEIVIVDDGMAFDPVSVPARPAPRRLDELIPGGRGVQLIRHFVDDIRYRRQGGHNILTLTRVLPSRGGGP